MHEQSMQEVKFNESHTEIINYLAQCYYGMPYCIPILHVSVSIQEVHPCSHLEDEAMTLLVSTSTATVQSSGNSVTLNCILNKFHRCNSFATEC